MTQHVLAQCPNRHIIPLSFNGSINKSYWNKIVPAIGETLSCHECKTTNNYNYNFYAIAQYDARLSINKFVVETFGRVSYFNKDQLLKMNKDSVRKILTDHNFVYDEKSNICDKTMVFSSPEGYKAVFIVKSGCKTQQMFLLVPAKHELIKKIDSANKNDKRQFKIEAPPKIICPTVIKDCLGTELFVGDWVAYSSMSYTALRFGKITKINPKSVTLKDSKGGRKIPGKDVSQIIKIPDERAMLLMLES
jgi:hypothetical protein